MTDDEQSGRLFWTGAGGVTAIMVAAALVPLRSVLVNADVALVLVLVVVVAAVGGGRQAGAVTAVVCALSFDFFHTRPYLQLRIASQEDVTTMLLLLGVGFLVGEVASRGRLARSSAEARTSQIRRIHRVADLAARGDDAADVILGAQAELTDLLDLRDCRFEAIPFSPPLPRLERGGVVSWQDYRVHHGGVALPADGAELPVLGRGRSLGRFVLVPGSRAAVSLEQRVVALAIADQVGAVLAAPQAQGRDHTHG
jgi:hypothetical protein